MAEIIQFPRSLGPAVDDGFAEIDIFTAVEVAIRDLRDIAVRLDAASRRQADDCREMLETVLRASAAD
ncbi:MAG: hypothetical protein AB7O56_09005 [Bauldia sp.]